ncbi:MAG TPA: enoyl-CoA hydratase-related protein, partial [Paracoccaceae bacterium]
MSEPDRQAVRQVRVGPESGRAGGVVLELIIDNPPVNALSHAVRVGLAAGIAAAGADASVMAVVIRAEGRTFPAGADISEFGKPALAPLLPDLCNLVEACAKPVVAAVHGTALGGGLELALAAHFRLARADARLGLPEVGLGILPGAGGTQRMPRLIGAEQALRLMLGGRPIGAAEALALGLLDRVVEDGLEAAALAMARAAMGQVPVPTRERRDGMRDGVAYQAAVAAARLHQHGARLPAPERIVDCVEAAQLLPFDQGLAYERRAFTDLVATPEAAGLRHAFFAERAAARMPEAGAAPRALREIGVAGSGGADLTLTLLQAGFAVTLAEADRPALVAALEAIAARQEEAVQAGRRSPGARDADWARLQPAAGAGALAEADLVLIADAASLAGVVQAARPGAVLVL